MNQNPDMSGRANSRFTCYSKPEVHKSSPLSQVHSYADIVEGITTSKGQWAPILATHTSVSAENKRAEGAPSELKSTKDPGSGSRDTAPNPSQPSSTREKRTHISTLNNPREDNKEAASSRSTHTSGRAKTQPFRGASRSTRGFESGLNSQDRNFVTPARSDGTKRYSVVSQRFVRSNRSHSTNGEIGSYNNITSRPISQRNIHRKGLPIGEVPEEHRNAILSLVRKNGKAEEIFP